MNKYYRLLNISRYAIIIILIALMHHTWARKPYLKSGSTINIHSLGLKIKMPKFAKPNPAKSVTVKNLTQRRGKETRKIEAYLLEELWLRDQLSGSYGNKDFMVTVYKMRLPAPSDVKALFKQPGHIFVLKSVYEQWLEDQQPVKWNKELMRRWLSYLVTEELDNNIKLVKKNLSSSTVIYYADSAEHNNINSTYILVSPTPPVRHIVIQFKLSPSLDYKKSLKTIKRCLTSASFYPPVKLKKDGKKMTISRKRTVVPKAWSPEYTASRERVINNIKNLENWWYMETANFIVVANIENRKVVKELKIGLEKSRMVFMQLYPIKKPLKAVSVVKAFETRKEYIAYIGKQYEWTGGLWMANKKELVVSPINFGSARTKREMLVEVIQHEGFHQYIYFATGEQHTAVWFNEGNATFFEGIEYKGKKVVIESTYRTAKVADIAASADISKLLTMSHREFYGINKTYNYILAYGLMFFLQKGAEEMKGKYKNNYSKIPFKYYQAILKTSNAAQATKIAWHGVNMKQFHQAFRKFWDSKRLINKAIRHDILK